MPEAEAYNFIKKDVLSCKFAKLRHLFYGTPPMATSVMRGIATSFFIIIELSLKYYSLFLIIQLSCLDSQTHCCNWPNLKDNLLQLTLLGKQKT